MLIANQMHLAAKNKCRNDQAPCACCIDKIRSHVASSGGRVTRERLKIMNFVCNYTGHFTAEGLAQKMSDAGALISLPTIYRNLPVLLDAGIIRRTGFFEEAANQALTYEHVFGRPHHDHLLCRRCGKRVEFQYPAIEVLQEAVAREHGFALEGHHLELVGVCAGCRGAEVAP